MILCGLLAQNFTFSEGKAHLRQVLQYAPSPNWYSNHSKRFWSNKIFSLNLLHFLLVSFEDFLEIVSGTLSPDDDSPGLFSSFLSIDFVICLAGSITEGSSNGSIGLFSAVLSSDFVFSPVGSICELYGSPAPDCSCISKSVAESSIDAKAKSILVILEPMLLLLFVMFLTGLSMLFVTVVFLSLFEFGFFEDTFISR